jgi:hypothetical protein
MLKAFEVLAAATPIVRFGHATANHAMTSATAPPRGIRIVEVPKIRRAR